MTSHARNPGPQTGNQRCEPLTSQQKGKEGTQKGVGKGERENEVVRRRDEL